MATSTYKAVVVKLDGAAGTIVDISSMCNSASVANALSILEDTGFGVEERTYEPGANGATVSLNGFVNSTTAAIFGPLVGNRTSITKTIGIYNGLKYHTGEVWPTNPTVTLAVDALNTWSCDFTFEGACNYTSVAPA